MKRVGFVFLTLLIAAAAQGIKMTALEDFEHRFEAELAKTTPPYPFEVLTPSPAIHAPGMGVMLSSVVNLSYVDPLSPFHQSYSPKELAVIHERKLARVPVLERHMREVLADTATSPGLDQIPPTERIVLGVSLFYFSWENTEGLPRQIVMSAEKQALLKARRDKLDLTTVIQEQKL